MKKEKGKNKGSSNIKDNRKETKRRRNILNKKRTNPKGR